MRLRNKSNDRLKRNANGCWIVVNPGGTLELDDNEAMYLMKYEPHYWENADKHSAPKPEPIPEPVAEAKPKPTKKGGE